MKEPDNELEWTGERYVPQLRGTIALEHLHRYAFASCFLEGKEVLDIASGEGYGSDLLSKVAKSVHGVDVDDLSVAHANRKYGTARLKFLAGDACSIPLEAHSVDAVVSFETLEHVEDQDTMLSEFKRILRPGGLVIISSPEKHAYNQKNEHENPYHKKELDFQEFENLLKGHFRNVRMFGQYHLGGSAILPDQFRHQNAVRFRFSDLPGNPRNQIGLSEPLYLLAFCSDDDLPVSEGSFCEQSVEETDYAASMTALVSHGNSPRVDQLTRELEDMRGSLSWKLTAPLRYLRDSFSRIFR
jgi:SAM-dependent methyltransferase